MMLCRSSVYCVLPDLHLLPWWLMLAVDTIIAIRLFQTQASTGCEL